MNFWSDQTWLAILIVSSSFGVLLLIVSLYAPQLFY
jgi:hypothetical protein